MVEIKRAETIIKHLIEQHAKPTETNDKEELRKLKEYFKTTKRNSEHLKQLLDKQMDMPEIEKKFCYLWVIGTYSHRLFTHYPYILINAPKSSGKSKLIKILTWNSDEGYISTNITPAGLYYLINEKHATIGFDESEVLSDRERGDAINNILLAGFEKGNFVYRVNKKANQTLKLEQFDTYSPKLLANIRGLSDDALESRCIPIYLSRSKKSTLTSKYPLQADKEHMKFRLTILEWSLKNKEKIKKENQKNIKIGDLVGRPHNLFKPIIIICKLLKPEWLTEMTQYCVEKSQEMETTLSDDSQEAMIIKALLNEYTDTTQQKILIQAKTIKEKIELYEFEGERQKWLTYWFISKILKRLGFKKERRGTGVFYAIPKTQLYEITIKYDVLTQEELDEKEMQEVQKIK